MWQKVDGKYHWLLRADQMEDGQMAQTYCEEIVRVQHKNQVDYVTNRDDRCGFCDGVAEIIHTAAYEAIQYGVKRETRVDVLRRAIQFTSSVTLTKAINTKIRKLEKAASNQ